MHAGIITTPIPRRALRAAFYLCIPHTSPLSGKPTFFLGVAQPQCESNLFYALSAIRQIVSFQLYLRADRANDRSLYLNALYRTVIATIIQLQWIHRFITKIAVSWKISFSEAMREYRK